MTTRHPKQLLVIIAEAALEKPLARDARQLGANGYTVADVRGAGGTGVREGAWEADRTIQMSVICDPQVADRIAEHVLQAYAPHYGLTMYFTPAEVLRPDKF